MPSLKLLHYVLVAAIISVAAAPCARTEIVSYAGFTLPQTGNLSQPPDTNCNRTPDATCTGTASSNYTLTAADGSPILGLTSELAASYLGTEYGYYTTFQMWFSGAVEDEIYNDSNWVGVEPGDSVGASSSFADLTSDELISMVESQPTGGQIDYDTPLGPRWEGRGDTIYWGTEFQDQGQTHYGWLDFKYNVWDYGASVDIGGYAYESCPDTPITVGATSGGASCSDPPSDPPAPEPGALLLFGTGIVAVLYRIRAWESLRAGSGGRA
ncbi:MAG: PEP-CTERM sorting domain-containing protein [Terriglobia bacterium]